MKKLNLILGTVCFIALSIVCTYVVSCSSKEEPFNSSEEKIVIKTITSVDELNDELLAFLDSLNQPQSRGYTPDVNFKDDSCVEISDGGSGVSAMMMMYPNSTTKAVATYTKDSNTEKKLVIAEDLGNGTIILYDKDNIGLVELSFDSLKNTYVCTKILSNQRVLQLACNINMAAVGWSIGTMLALPSGGTSMLFSVLWEVASYMYCSNIP